MRRIFLAVMLSIYMVGCGTSDEVNVGEKAETEAVAQPVNIKDSIDSSVYKTYTSDDEPTAIKQFGSRLDDIQALREQFAEQAVTSGKCEKVTASEVKIDSDIKNPEFFIFCLKEGKEKQIYSNEADIKANAPLLSKDEKGLNDKDATTACIKLIENNTKEYSKVDINYIADQTFLKMVDGSAQVKIGFDVTNAFNAEVPYLASCNFDKDGNETDFSMTQGKR